MERWTDEQQTICELWSIVCKIILSLGFGHLHWWLGVKMVTTADYRDLTAAPNVCYFSTSQACVCVCASNTLVLCLVRVRNFCGFFRPLAHAFSKCWFELTLLLGASYTIHMMISWQCQRAPLVSNTHTHTRYTRMATKTHLSVKPICVSLIICCLLVLWMYGVHRVVAPSPGNSRTPCAFAYCFVVSSLLSRLHSHRVDKWMACHRPSKSTHVWRCCRRRCHRCTVEYINNNWIYRWIGANFFRLVLVRMSTECCMNFGDWQTRNVMSKYNMLAHGDKYLQRFYLPNRCNQNLVCLFGFIILVDASLSHSLALRILMALK